MAVSQTRTPGRPLLFALAQAAQQNAGGALTGQNMRRKDPAAQARRAARVAFAHQFGLSTNVNDWDSDTIEKARAAGWLPQQAADQAQRTSPTPENVQASVDAGRAMMDTISSQRAGNVRSFRPPTRRQPNGNLVAALRAIGL